MNNGKTFYPTSFEIFALNIKLFLAPVTKGSGWKALVRKDSPTLDADALTRVIPFNPNVQHINDFKKVCKLREVESSIPFLYPAVVVLYPNCCLFAAAEYPFPAVGSVHIYNTTTLYRNISVSEKFVCVLKAEKTIKHAKKGSELEFISNLLDDNKKTIWSNSSKFLVMHNQRKKLSDTNITSTEWSVPPLESDLSLLFEDIWTLGPNASIEYANVSKDFNPIHTNSLLAKLFGFPGIIMHGMYMIARAASECQRVMTESVGAVSYPLEVSTKFQRPCVLPQKVSFNVSSIKGNKKSLYFVIKGKGDKILLDGYFKTIAASK